MTQTYRIVKEYKAQSRPTKLAYHTAYLEGYWHNNSTDTHSEQHLESWNADGTGLHAEARHSEHINSRW